MREMRKTLRSAFQRALRLENRRVAPRIGHLDHMGAFPSAILGNSREVVVYLPPGYEEREERRYPVLYMQDGQNLFEPERAFIHGQHWRLAEAANEVISARRAAPMIIVGVDHAGVGRMEEYTPTLDRARQAGGKASDYLRMLTTELKPVIDGRYRTLEGRENTGIGGSSLGGLLALYAIAVAGDVFGRAAVMSPSVWWDGATILRLMDETRIPKLRFWLDIGGREGKEALLDARRLRDRLVSMGWTESDFRYFEDRRADHSERAWAQRAPAMLEFLFPPDGG